MTRKDNIEEQAPSPSGAAPAAADGGAAPAVEPESAREQPMEPGHVAQAAQAEESHAAQAEASQVPEAAPAPAAQSGRSDALDEAAIAELRERAAKADEYLGLAQRTQADFENFRKRTARDAQGAESRGAGRLAKELLPALDNLERALAAAEASEADPDHHMTKGMRLVQSELQAALNRVGIEGFAPRGEPFDPNEHEAVAQQSVEGAAQGTVVEVVQAGYRLNGAILRPARVIVAG